MNYKYPIEFLTFNKNLFEIFNLTYPENVWGRKDFLFKTFRDENIHENLAKYFYFKPQREDDDNIIIATNMGIIPQIRIGEMSPVPSTIITGRIQYRYDTMNKMILDNYGNIDWDFAEKIAERLSPDNVPGFWNDREIPNLPMSAQVKGVVNLMDTKRKIMKTKSVLFNFN